MNAFLLYVLQSTLCLSLFYGLYLLLLQRDTFFRFNRCVLLTIVVTSMLIPLIRMPVTEPALIQLPMMQLEEVFIIDQSGHMAIPATEMSEIARSPTIRDTKISFNVFPLIYFAGLIASLVVTLISIIGVIRIIATARTVMYRQQKILVSPMKINSFFFAGKIVLSEMDYERFATEIITHEDIHRRKGHFWDLCLLGVVMVIHWFNPLVWLLRREMKALHEYEADRSTLTQGIDATRYKLLLIEKAAGATRYSVASSFAQSKIKKRIVMMNKQNFNPWARWKVLLFIPLAALLLQAFARPEIKLVAKNLADKEKDEIVSYDKEAYDDFVKWVCDSVQKKLSNVTNNEVVLSDREKNEIVSHDKEAYEAFVKWVCEQIIQRVEQQRKQDKGYNPTV